MKRILHTDIRNFFKKKLKEIYLPKEVIDTTVDSLVEASLFGIDSHGVNLFSHYYDCLKEGRINKGSDIDLEIKGSSIKCNANNNLANYAARKLLLKLDSLSDINGISFGTIINSDHIGAVGIHAVNSKISNKLIFGFTNADALAVTPDGNDILFGTNPISMVIRIKNKLTYIDLATTKFSMNKVKNYRRAKENLPNEIARDKELKPTNNPNEAEFLEPIGSHKGFALAYMVELLTSGLTNQNHSKFLMPMYGTDLNKKRGVSHSFIVLNPTFLGNEIIDSLIKCISITNENISPYQSLLNPGIKETLTKKQREIEGIPVSELIISGWQRLGFKDD
jgi:LDH2 family malate/lactate/ureidoglycolate dehydrogenase